MSCQHFFEIIFITLKPKLYKRRWGQITLPRISENFTEIKRPIKEDGSMFHVKHQPYIQTNQALWNYSPQ